MMPAIADVIGLQQLVARFANSFDLKDWASLQACLAEEIDTDYSALRGTPPERITRSAFIALRQTALEDLRTHHLVGNVEVDVRGDTGFVRASMAIFRCDSNNEYFNTHCFYDFGVVRGTEQWLICAIVQRVFLNEGSASIHRGVRRS